ncbi:MAG: hypothetical protein IJ682_03600 [Lachnospiraceae bacterium]|nr:hypothetical protein [Lachnospiraceae bacterium]
MSIAKEKIMKELNAISDDMDDELEVINNLYHRVRLKYSKESVEKYGTFSTDEVREYFMAKRKQAVVS